MYLFAVELTMGFNHRVNSVPTIVHNYFILSFFWGEYNNYVTVWPVSL